MVLLSSAPVSPHCNEPLGDVLWYSGNGSHTLSDRSDLDMIKPRVHLTLILMRESLFNNSVDNSVDAFMVHFIHGNLYQVVCEGNL